MMQLSGARMAYVVVALKGEVEREVTYMKQKKVGKHRDGTDRVSHELVREMRKEPAGFMVYCPRGHAIRVRNADDLKKYGLDKQAHIINMDGLADPNSPLGKMMLSQDEASRKGGFLDMQNAVIKMATAKTGTVLMPEQVAKKEMAHV